MSSPSSTPVESARDEMLGGVSALAPLIASSREAIQAERHLPAALVDGLKRLGALRMAVPREYGGLELDPVTQVRVVEELARLDASVGWCAMVASSISMSSAFLSPAAAQRLCGRDDLSMAGTQVPSGQAERVDGGYRVNGTWRFGSGCQHATLLMAGCAVTEDGEPRRLPSGGPEVRMMMMWPQDAQIHDTWHTTGLAGTGSHDFTVEDAFVPADETWAFGDPARVQGALYRFPAMFLAVHAGVPLGIARSAIDEQVAILQAKPLPPDVRAQDAVARAEGALAGARSFTYGLLEELWDALQRDQEITLRQRAMFRIMLVEAHEVAKRIATAMYAEAGTAAIYRPHALDRLERDILTACQHGMVHARNYAPAAQSLLGMEPAGPLF